MDQVTTKNRDKSSLFRDARVISKLRQKESMMAWTIFGDQTCAGRLSIASRTLYLNGEKSTHDCWCQHQKKRENPSPVGIGAWRTLSTTEMSLKSTRKSSSHEQRARASSAATWK
jgi:hypothetical protein